MNRYPYYQGHVIAGFLDGQLRSATRDKFSIDSLMFGLYRTVRATSRKVDDSVFAAAAPATIRSAVRDSIAGFVVAGNTIPVTAESFGKCLDVRTEQMYQFDLGDRVVSGVKLGSTADSAGIQNGTRLRGWSWFNGDPKRSASIRVSAGDSTRTIAWLPRSNSAIDVPQITVRAGCRPAS